MDASLSDRLHTLAPSTYCGCAIEEFATSPSGHWIVTSRWSGQGEWGYDVFKSTPLERRGGTLDRYGYILDLPAFANDESYLLLGYGEDWLGGWWCHPDDDELDFYETPARGGDTHFGWLLKHHLPSQKVETIELRMILPQGWIPHDPESESWFGPRSIEPHEDGFRLMLPGGHRATISGPLGPIVHLPTPRPNGKGLIE